MNRKIGLFLLVCFGCAQMTAWAGTKEELMRLQNDVLALQNQMREFEKTFTEKIDGLKSLVGQLNDEIGNSGITLKQIAAILEKQSSGTQSADQKVIQEIRALSSKIDDSATRISALAQQVSELKVEYTALEQQASSAAIPSPDEMYSQAMKDFVQGNFDLAIQGFTAYVTTYPGGEQAAAALINIGEAYRSQKQLPQAVSAFTRVVEEYPGTASVSSALYKRGMLQVAMGEKEKAIADLKDVIAKFPESPEAAQAKIELQRISPPAKKPARAPVRKSR